MSTQGRSSEPVSIEGMYVCADGCERRYYQAGEQFLTCAVESGTTLWTKVEDI